MEYSESFHYTAELFLWATILISAVLVCKESRNLHSLVYLSIFSFTCSLLYLLMQAPDVAITEAAIGAAISAVYFLYALKQTHDAKPEPLNQRIFFSAALMLAIAIIFYDIAVELPEYSNPESPAALGTSAKYLETAYAQTGIPNIVTAVLASYRGFDTLGEVYVVFAAALSVVLILPHRAKESDA